MKHLQLLQELISSEFWDELKKEIALFYETADNMLHSTNNTNREYYAGKCRGYKDIIELEDNISRTVKLQEEDIRILEDNKK